MTDLSVEIAGIRFDSYIFNASGPRCTTIDELITLGESDSGAIMTQSCTVESITGDSESRYIALPHGSVHSMGPSNLGFQAYVDMVPILKQQKKTLVISISGLSLEDDIAMVDAFMMTNADLIEISFCNSNIVGKPQLGYDFEQADKALGALTHLGDTPIGIKLPFYFDQSHFDTMAEIIATHPVSFITFNSSLSDALVIDSENESSMVKAQNRIEDKDGADVMGGLSGSYIKPLGLANVFNFKKRLPEHIKVIGVGGINSGIDAFEYALAGADAVQVATCFQKEGNQCFTRLAKELEQVLAQKGYTNITDVIGKLKT